MNNCNVTLLTRSWIECLPWPRFPDQLVVHLIPPWIGWSALPSHQVQLSCSIRTPSQHYVNTYSMRGVEETPHSSLTWMNYSYNIYFWTASGHISCTNWGSLGAPFSWITTVVTVFSLDRSEASSASRKNGVRRTTGVARNGSSSWDRLTN